MSLTIVGAINRIVGDANRPLSSTTTEDYRTRPADVSTRGLNVPPPDTSRIPAGSIASPLTEVSRVEEDVYVAVPPGTETVHLKIASQITMEDADGNTFVFNYDVPPPP